MAYIICEPCIGTKDSACVDVCPVDCIHPRKDEPGFETARDALYSPGRVHRLRRVRAGVSGRSDLRARRDAGEVEELHSGERGVLPEVAASAGSGSGAARPSGEGAGGHVVGSHRVHCDCPLQPRLRRTGGGPVMPRTFRRALTLPRSSRPARSRCVPIRRATPSCSSSSPTCCSTRRATARRSTRSTGRSQPATPALAPRARKGKVRTRAAHRRVRRRRARKPNACARDGAPDAEALTLYGDALWSSGLFDEADRAYRDALGLAPESSRARFGMRAIAGDAEPARRGARRGAGRRRRRRRATARSTPRIGDIYERLNRFDEAANAYTNYINLLPNKDRSDKAAWSRAQVALPRGVRGRDARSRSTTDDREHAAHGAVPAGEGQDRRAGARSTAAAPHGLRARHRLGGDGHLARDGAARAASVRSPTRSAPASARSACAACSSRGSTALDIGTLQIRNLPVLIKNPALRGIPKREGESFSPLSLGMSMMIDYQKRLLTIGRNAAGGRRRLHACRCASIAWRWCAAC